MIKRIKILGLLLLVSSAGFCQVETPGVNKPLYFARGGAGTSWIIMPKVFLVNPADTTSAQILPAINSFTGYLGFQTVIPLGKRWIFAPGLEFNYISGEIRVDHLPGDSNIPSNFSQKLQTYTRIEVPLNFGLISSDNFWVTFGPAIYFTLSDNKGFDEAVADVATNPVTLDSDIPIGLRFRIASYLIVGKGMYVDIKFDSDLKQGFKYEDGTYNMRMSLQNITVGFGYRLNRTDP